MAVSKTAAAGSWPAPGAILNRYHIEMKEQIENERKFLLKREPNNIVSIRDEVYALEQFYTKDNVRYRKETNLKTGNHKWQKVKKEDTDSTAARIEILEDITMDEYADGIQNCIKKISKIRTVILMDDYKIDLDKFMDVALVVAEVEITSDSVSEEVTDQLYNVKLPEYIEKEIIMEVTDFSEFKNQNLAVPIR